MNAVIVMISGLAVAAAALQALIGSSLHILLGQSMMASCAACAHRRQQACPMTLYQACPKVQVCISISQAHSQHGIAVLGSIRLMETACCTPDCTMQTVFLGEAYSNVS